CYRPLAAQRHGARRNWRAGVDLDGGRLVFAVDEAIARALAARFAGCGDAGPVVELSADAACLVPRRIGDEIEQPIVAGRVAFDDDDVEADVRDRAGAGPRRGSSAFWDPRRETIREHAVAAKDQARRAAL